MDRRDFLVTSGLVAASAASAAPVLAQNTVLKSETPKDNRDVDPHVNDMLPYEGGRDVKKIRVVNTEELAEEARKILPKGGFDYIAGASGAEWTLRENRAAFDRIQIEPLYLTGSGQADTSVTILGSTLKMPIIIPPMGSHGLAHVSKEAGTAKGAAAAGTLFVPSMESNLSMEDIAASAVGPRWAQIYFPGDRGFAREIGMRAKAAGYTAMVATVDTVVSYPREANIRNAFRTPTSLGKGNAPRTIADPVRAREAMESKKRDLSFDDLVWFKKEVGLPVFVKGVLSPKTASGVVERGLDGVWISNHGGRALDGVPATITQLPRIAEAVKGRVPIVLDSGVRRGPDVFRALALGATVVAVGRPTLYALALGGWMGVQSMLESLNNELSLAMELAGTGTLKSITREYLAPPFHV